MGKKKTLSDAERLAKNREYQKQRLIKIKSDPDKKLKEQERERKKYLNKKAKGVVKPIKQQSARVQRATKKKWAINSRKYRETKNAEKRVNQFLVDGTPPTSPESDLIDDVAANNVDKGAGHSRKISGKKKVRRDRSKLYRANVSLKKEVKRLKTISEKYRKRNLRSKSKTTPNNCPSTPRTRVTNMLIKSKVTPEVRRRLLMGVVVENQLEESIGNLKDEKSKQTFAKLVLSSGVFLKKYKLLNQCSFLKYKQIWTSMKRTDVNTLFKDRNRLKSQSSKMREDVVTFLEQDIHSRMCPGKKEYITRNKISKQKRLLNDNLFNLHAKFNDTHTYKLSYSTFCRCRPFWVVHPNVQDRETCKCATCGNMEFIVQTLYKLEVIEGNTPDLLLKDICCKKKDIEDCLLKKCNDCLENSVIFGQEFDINKKTSYKKWKSVRETYTDNKSVEKVATKVKIEEVVCTIGDAINELENTLEKYMTHVASHRHQYTTVLRTLKQNLSDKEVLIHVDFSENYSCKYGVEIQSLHFGGSRAQITLHTGVLYYRKEDKTEAKSFCTVSESLRHDPAAIWAHLEPILDIVKETMPNVDVLHFMSDSPATQYRNRTMFHYIQNNLIDTFPALRAATWNYSESGHGKGAPDGIGGVLKRTADRAVAHAQDVNTYGSFLKVVQERCKGIDIIPIQIKDIVAKEVALTTSQIQGFSGTMKVHQVTWSQPHRTMSFRSLSCFECKPMEKCLHFNLGLRKNEPAEDEGPAETVQVGFPSLHVGEFVAANYEGTVYPGQVLEIKEDQIRVDNMEKTTCNNYKWPAKPDIYVYLSTEIVRKISNPIPLDGRSRGSIFHFTDFP